MADITIRLCWLLGPNQHVIDGSNAVVETSLRFFVEAFCNVALLVVIFWEGKFQRLAFVDSVKKKTKYS